MSFRERLERDLQRVPPEVADLIRQYRASVDAGNPNLDILAEIQAIQTAVNTLLGMKHSVPDVGGSRKRTKRRKSRR